MSYKLLFNIYTKVCDPLTSITDRTWRYATGETLPWNFCDLSSSEMLDSKCPATPTASQAANSLVAGAALGSIVPAAITLLGLLMLFSSVLVFVGRVDKTTGFKWVLRTLLTLAAAVVLVATLRLAWVLILAVLPLVQIVYSSLKYFFMSVDFLARLVYTHREDIVRFGESVVRFVVTYYPLAFGFAVSAVRHLFAFVKHTGSFFTPFICDCQ